MKDGWYHTWFDGEIPRGFGVKEHSAHLPSLPPDTWCLWWSRIAWQLSCFFIVACTPSQNWSNSIGEQILPHQWIRT